jgi:hypothetical protein
LGSPLVVGRAGRETVLEGRVFSRRNKPWNKGKLLQWRYFPEIQNNMSENGRKTEKGIYRRSKHTHTHTHKSM